MKSAMILVILAFGPGTTQESPWPAPAKDWIAPQPGEHPRLFFRKANLPAIRKQAESPEGKLILARLKFLLGGGEAMPEHFSKATKAYDAKEDLPLGAYTLWHGMGFGMLYQITGEKKYAALGRECVQKAFDGVRDIDDRLSWMGPAEFMRAGPSMSAIAEAYDLCYDGWDPDFRQKVALEIQEYSKRATKPGKQDGLISLERMCLSPFMPPTSNHFANEIGGAAICVLAIKGDPGTDDGKLARWLEGVEKSTVAELTRGFGDGGYFWEHEGPGECAAGESFTPALQAWKIAGGKDFLSGPRSSGRAITTKWIWELVSMPEGPFYPNHTAKKGQGSGYGNEEFGRLGGHHGGHFAQGFGAIPEEMKPALLWTYRHIVEPTEKKQYASYLPKGEASFDALQYPQRAVFSLINWPIGIPEKNPAEILPKVLVDSVHGHYVFRNQWKDSGDIVVAVLLGARPGDRPRRVIVFGMNERIDFGQIGPSKETTFQLAEDGSGILNTDSGGAIGVDFSKTSGAEALVVLVGSAPAGAKAGAQSRISTVPLGKGTASILTLGGGQIPEPKQEGDRIMVGGQTISWDGQRIAFGKMAGPARLKQ